MTKKDSFSVHVFGLERSNLLENGRLPLHGRIIRLEPINSRDLSGAIRSAYNQAVKSRREINSSLTGEYSSIIPVRVSICKNSSLLALGEISTTQEGRRNSVDIVWQQSISESSKVFLENKYRQLNEAIAHIASPGEGGFAEDFELLNEKLDLMEIDLLKSRLPSDQSSFLSAVFSIEEKLGKHTNKIKHLEDALGM